VTRDPALRPYRLAVYSLYALFCGFIFLVMIRSVIRDLYGRPPITGPQESPTACLEDVERLYAELSSRAVAPAPFGLESDQLSREWDSWSRRWEDEVERVSQRCNLEAPAEPAGRALSDALEGIEELRRRLSRSGADTAADARQVKQSLAEARRQLHLK
jgi:hypothetical protein